MKKATFSRFFPSMKHHRNILSSLSIVIYSKQDVAKTCKCTRLQQIIRTLCIDNIQHPTLCFLLIAYDLSQF
jgi:hypothetical protein